MTRSTTRRGVGLLAARVAVLLPAASARADTVTRRYRALTGPLLMHATASPATNFIGG